MRRPVAALGLAAGVSLIAAAPTVSHPGHGYLPVSIKNLSYSPATLDALQGDTVIWFWEGADRNHSVTADPGQDEVFDSDPAGPPSQSTHSSSDSFSHRFTQVGTFNYHCKVHPSMRGTVRVAPFGGGEAPPDETAPALSKVVAEPSRFCVRRGRRCRRPGTVLEFTLGEKADVLIEIRRRKGSRSHGGVVDALDPRGRVGRNRVKLRGGRLKPGAYRLSVVATDAAGNSSRTRRVDVSVRR